MSKLYYIINSYDLVLLFLPTIFIFFVTFITSVVFTKWIAFSIFLAFVKSTIFLIYFSIFFDGTYTFWDDWAYIEGGKKLYFKDIGITNLIDSFQYLLLIGKGNHFIYYLYNTYSFRIFGEGYYAPVALNIILTSFIAYIGARLAFNEFYFSRKSEKLFFIFLMLHPDILAWSNVYNGKDILVLLIHVIFLTTVSLYLRGRIIVSIILMIPIVTTLLFLRAYVPLLFGIALILSNLIINKKGKWVYFIVSLIITSTILFSVGQNFLQYSWLVLQNSLVNPIYGFVRFLLTPIPFNTELNYSFLNIPALIHWILIPFVFIGIHRVWYLKTFFTRFFIIYIFVFLSLYSIFSDLQGPRHRVQLDFALAILQFVGLMVVLKLKYQSNDIKKLNSLKP